MENKCYIDGGYHHGGGYEEMLERQIVKRNWRKIGFEPNPEIAWVPDWVRREALSDENGEVTFYPQGLGETPADEMGSTALLEFQQALGGFQQSKAVTVKTCRLSDLILNQCNTHNPDKVVLKLDVEGMEYRIITDLLKTGAAKMITDAYIEFHDWLDFGHSKSETEKLKQLLRNAGVNVHYHE